MKYVEGVASGKLPGLNVEGQMVAEKGVVPVAVVGDFDEVKMLGLSLFSSGEIAAVDQLDLDGALKASHGCVIVAFTAADYGVNEAGGILDAAIGMEVIDAIQARLTWEPGTRLTEAL
jgi:hypothetical protein